MGQMVAAGGGHAHLKNGDKGRREAVRGTKQNSAADFHICTRLETRVTSPSMLAREESGKLIS